MLLDELLEKLDGVRKQGKGYQARCPAHEDREASLSVTEGDDSLLLKCHAGCETKDVLDAISLGFPDLLLVRRESSKGQEPEALYSYTDELGNEIWQQVRFPGKKFKRRHQDPDDDKADEDGWVWNTNDCRKVPYRLPEVIAAVAAGEMVYVCEGEKDAESMRAVGKVATTSGGTGTWRAEFNEFFSGAKVVVIQDKDEPGRNHAEFVRSNLEGVGARVWVVQARVGKDATDHLEAGKPVEDFRWMRQTRRGIVTTAELAEHARDRLTMTSEDLPGYNLASEIPLVFRPGRMYAIGAYTGDGKTSLALQGLRTLASAGRRVGYFSLEMPEIDLVNRLIAHKGVPLGFTESPWKILGSPMAGAYEGAVSELESWHSEIVFDSDVNAESIRDRTIDREYEVIFVDHLHRFSWKDRGALDAQVKGLTNIALELNCLVVVLCQLRKSTRGQGFETYPRPTLQDFRETSQIGDDASMALAVWRQRDSTGLKYTGATEVIVLKNRHTTGVQDCAGKVFMPHFDADRQTFTGGGS